MSAITLDFSYSVIALDRRSRIYFSRRYISTLARYRSFL